MTDLLRVRDLHVQFELPEGTLNAVNGVSFRIKPGSTVALVGESGSGKTVVSQTLLGLLPKVAKISGGEMLFADPSHGGGVVDLAALDPDGGEMRKLRGGRMSIIFQEPMSSLSPLHTIGDQITEAIRLHMNRDPREATKIAREMLDKVGFPNPDKALDTYPFELSGGLRQRAMIAMALSCRPALLIADEPTTALDVTIQAQILKLMKDLQQEFHMAILLITHDLGVVANMADEVVVMYHGQVMEAGPVDEIFRNPRHPYLKALLHAVPRFGMKAGERLTPLREIKARTAEAGRAAVPWSEEAKKAGPLLEARGLSKTYRLRKQGLFKSGEDLTHRAVDDMNFHIERGECLGLVGESGCGKTTACKMLLRAMSADEGQILFNDHGRIVDLLTLDQSAMMPYRRKIQYVFQDPYQSLNPRMSVFDIISEPLIIHEIGTPQERMERVKRLMELVGLDVRHLRRYPHSFSGGQRQRIGIARALALDPELLICDEPVSALDVSVQAQILNLLKDLQKDLELTYLFISHNLAVVNYIADRIAVMCDGHIVETAPRESLFSNPVHPYTRALLEAVPTPDLDQPLDFAHLMKGRASDPRAWPEPFRLAGRPSKMVEVAPGHQVRATSTDKVLEVA